MKCDRGVSFEDCELAILRHAVDNAEKRTGKKLIDNPEIQKIIQIVEQFLIKKRRIVYGGTAINNILPAESQFYDKSTEFPDYDFFSPEPLKDAKKLADIYYSQGFDEVEAKAGTHTGTFKVFVNFIPVADITYLVPELYKSLSKKALTVAGVRYAPPNYLRMALYLELSRPKGDVSRWEKILKRLILLNKSFPITGKDCDLVEVQRMFEPEDKLTKSLEKQIFHIARETLINQQVVFFGAFSNKLYLRNLKRFRYKKIPNIPDFDVLSEDPQATASILKETLQEAGIKKVTIRKKDGIGEIIAPHYEVVVGGETIAFIYKPLACHSYNTIKIKGRVVRIATIDTMLSFYLAFIYARRPYYDVNRIVCMAHFLFAVQRKNRLKQKGLLRRFSTTCYGEEKSTKERVRQVKANKYRELQSKRGGREWEWYFLKYAPGENAIKKVTKRKTKRKKRKKRRKTRRRRSGILRQLGL